MFDYVFMALLMKQPSVQVCGMIFLLLNHILTLNPCNTENFKIITQALALYLEK